MSYSLISPPPTGAPLPVVAVANENMPYYAPASGGGGGGGGVNPAGISTNSVDAATGTKLRLNGGNGITIDTAGPGTVTINSVQINAVASDLQISSINGAAPGGAVPPNLTVSSLTSAALNGVSSITSPGLSTSIVLGTVGVSISSLTTNNLTVSTINGAAPGGAVPPNLTVSSLTSAALNGVSSITSPGLSTSIVLGTVGVSISSLTTNNLTVSTINGAAPGGAISTFDSISLNSISSLGSEVVIGPNLTVANTVACSALSTVSITPLNPGNSVVISTLTVSSLNGIAPGGASPIGNFSSINIGANGTIDMGTQFGVILMRYNGGQQDSIQWNSDDTFARFTYQDVEAVSALGPAGLSSITGAKVSFKDQNSVFDGVQVGALIVNANGVGAGSAPAIGSDVANNLYLWANNAITSSILVSSVNGAVPALTSYTQQDVGALFSTLFAANPSLSTIAY